MPQLDRPEREKFAQAIVEGYLPRQAFTKAGYREVREGRAQKLLVDPSVVIRVAEIRSEAIRRAADLEPIINGLMWAAAGAANLNTAPAYVAARGLLVEAARLKLLLASPPPDMPAIAKPPPPPRDMTEEEWLAAFAPKPTGDRP